MKRLQRPASMYRQDIERVLKSSERQSRHVAIGVAVSQAARYQASSPELQGLTSQLTNSSHKFFVNLYESRRKAVAVIKSRVRSMLDDVAAAECQYCGGLAAPTWFDHFLGKAALPELSLYAPNLIPCCPDCNHLKGEVTFAESGERKFLHFYDDDIDSLPELLVADLQPPKILGVPSVRYSIAASSHPLRDVFQRHFDALQLKRRYAMEAASRLHLLRTQARTSSDDQRSLARKLAEQADARNATYGRNEPLATLFRSVAASPNTLDWAVQP
jgi:hypothetical protein